ALLVLRSSFFAAQDPSATVIYTPSLHDALPILMKHGLRNAIIPVVTLLGTQLPQIIGGTVIIETVFGLPGMSRFLFEAINQRDYPVIQGVNLVVVSLIVVINLTVDTLYAVLDPRIRY